MKRTIGKILLFWLMFGVMLWADVKPLPKDLSMTRALSINCWQRTRTQQLLKDYIMIGLGSSYNQPRRHLKSLIELWDTRIEELTRFFTPGLKNYPKKMEEWNEALALWKKDKKILGEEPTTEGALQLQEDFHKIIHLLAAAKVLADKRFKAVGKAGSLCRAPLFMANNYLMKIWGIEIQDYPKKMQAYIKHFHQWLDQLRAYGHNTPETLAQIDKAAKAFMFFEFMYNAKSTFIPTLIYKKADDIFLIIRKLKDTYASDLERRLSQAK